MTIRTDRLLVEINKLAEFSASPAPAVTRIVYSKEDIAAREYLTGKFEEAGLAVRVDGVGNTFARWTGHDPSRRPIATGSHVDAIPNAGKYDGVVGVLGALEAIRALKDSGFEPAASLEILLFTAEEPTLFGIGCLGSRFLSGRLNANSRLIDSSGKSLDVWRKSAGFHNSLEQVAMEKNFYEAFIELHIEQGPILERENCQIGIVEKIAAPAACRLIFEGEGGHAGAVLMPDRKDALLGGAEAAIALEHFVKSLGSADGVATTGVFDILPRAINSVPFRATLEMDIRDTDLAARQNVEAAIRAEATEIAKRRNLQVSFETINSDPPAICDARLIQIISDASNGLTTKSLISRAYHDSLFMALLCPTAMIFIPCFQGYSHRPDEFSKPEDLEAGVTVLARTLATLAS